MRASQSGWLRPRTSRAPRGVSSTCSPTVVTCIQFTKQKMVAALLDVVVASRGRAGWRRPCSSWPSGPAATGHVPARWSMVAGHHCPDKMSKKQLFTACTFVCRRERTALAAARRHDEAMQLVGSRTSKQHCSIAAVLIGSDAAGHRCKSEC